MRKFLPAVRKTRERGKFLRLYLNAVGYDSRRKKRPISGNNEKEEKSVWSLRKRQGCDAEESRCHFVTFGDGAEEEEGDSFGW